MSSTAEKVLLSIAEHNRRVMDALQARKPDPTGVQCPVCLTPQELVFRATPAFRGDPPQREVECKECGWRGVILV